MKFNGMRFMLAATVVVAAACNRESSLGTEPSAGAGEQVSPSALRTGVEVSSKAVAPGGRVLVSVVAEADLPKPMITLQGDLRWNPAKLRYVGQATDNENWVTVNESAAARGQLKTLSVRLPKLGRTTASYVFEVKAAGYTAGLKYELQEASVTNGDAFVSGGTLAIVEKAATVPEAVRISDADALKFLASKGYAMEPTGAANLMNTRKASTRFGDVNLSGTLTGADAGILANVVVNNPPDATGSFELNHPAANRDPSFAGNVAPSNLPGLGEAGDACPPGASGCGTPTQSNGSITGADVGQIAQGAAALPACSNSPALDVACQTIPRIAAGAGRTIVQAPGDGIYTAADCAATPTLCNWAAGEVITLQGIVQFDSGAVLNIGPGVTVQGNTVAGAAALYIRRQGQVFARGTAAAPIVMTCASATKTKGCWAGFAMAGNARVNLQQSGAPAAPTNSRNPAGGGVTRFLEGTTAGGAPQMDYGGTNDADNSGIIEYVIVEYAGFIVGTNNELNGVTLGAIGSGTTIRNLQVHAGLDDGIEFFGGSVNVSNLLLTANSDDAFDWSFGYTGAAQFVIVQQDTLDADKGAEGDNNETAAADFDNTPVTTAPMWNFTWVGGLYPRATSQRPIPTGSANNVNDAIHVRRGNASLMGNNIIAGFSYAIDVDDDATCTAPVGGAQATTILGVVQLSQDGTGIGIGSAPPADVDPSCFSPDRLWFGASLATTDTAGIGAPDGTAAGSVGAVIAANLVRATDVLTPDFRPVSGSLAATGTAAVPTDSRIAPVSYRGACAPAASVSANNCFYMGWTRGWQNSTTP